MINVCWHYSTLLLTASVLESLYCVGHDADTSQESTSLLLVYLFVVPDANGDAISLAYVPVDQWWHTSLRKTIVALDTFLMIHRILHIPTNNDTCVPLCLASSVSMLYAISWVWRSFLTINYVYRVLINLHLYKVQFQLNTV